MGNKRIFLFGESEKGDYCTPLRLNTLPDLSQELGNPLNGTTGIDYAVQFLLFDQELIYYRVKEEGFAKEDYSRGVKLLYKHGEKLKISAICIPGVGDPEIIEALSPISKQLCSILIMTERDFFDYLTGSKY